MPLGAFIADKKLLDAFTDNPVLGQITTFGGHPVCCAARMAAMKVLLGGRNPIAIGSVPFSMFDTVAEKEKLFKTLLVYPKIKAVRSFGLWMAIEFNSYETNKKIIDACIAEGVLTDWFLFASNCLRISPPLIISEEQIRKVCQVIISVCDV